MPNDAPGRRIWERTAFGLVVAAAACDPAWRQAADPLDHPTRAWAHIYRDSLYEIALDTSRLGFDTRTSNVVFYRTDHALTHHRNGRPWNREVSQSVLWCLRMTYKVAAVDMSLSGGRPFAQQRTDEDDLQREPWRQIERGTVEEIAALAACDRIRRRGVAISAQRRAAQAGAPAP